MSTAALLLASTLSAQAAQHKVTVEPGTIAMVAGLPVVQDPQGTQEACTYRCPTGAIQWVEAGQFQALCGWPDEERPHA